MAGHRFAVLPDGTMVFDWTDNFTREAEVRVRTADGRIGPAKTVTTTRKSTPICSRTGRPRSDRLGGP